MADEAEADFLDPNEDICGACAKTGVLLCCDACPAAYHHRCAGYGAPRRAPPARRRPNSSAQPTNPPPPPARAALHPSPSHPLSPLPSAPPAPPPARAAGPAEGPSEEEDWLCWACAKRAGTRWRFPRGPAHLRVGNEVLLAHAEGASSATDAAAAEALYEKSELFYKGKVRRLVAAGGVAQALIDWPEWPDNAPEAVRLDSARVWRGALKPEAWEHDAADRCWMPLARTTAVAVGWAKGGARSGGGGGGGDAGAGPGPGPGTATARAAGAAAAAARRPRAPPESKAKPKPAAPKAAAPKPAAPKPAAPKPAAKRPRATPEAKTEAPGARSPARPLPAAAAAATGGGASPGGSLARRRRIGTARELEERAAASGQAPPERRERQTQEPAPAAAVAPPSSPSASSPSDSASSPSPSPPPPPPPLPAPPAAPAAAAPAAALAAPAAAPAAPPAAAPRWIAADDRRVVLPDGRREWQFYLLPARAAAWTLVARGLETRPGRSAYRYEFLEATGLPAPPRRLTSHEEVSAFVAARVEAGAGAPAEPLEWPEIERLPALPPPPAADEAEAAAAPVAARGDGGGGAARPALGPHGCWRSAACGKERGHRGACNAGGPGPAPAPAGGRAGPAALPAGGDAAAAAAAQALRSLQHAPSASAAPSRSEQAASAPAAAAAPPPPAAAEPALRPTAAALALRPGDAVEARSLEEEGVRGGWFAARVRAVAGPLRGPEHRFFQVEFLHFAAAADGGGGARREWTPLGAPAPGGGTAALVRPARRADGGGDGPPAGRGWRAGDRVEALQRSAWWPATVLGAGGGEAGGGAGAGRRAGVRLRVCFDAPPFAEGGEAELDAAALRAAHPLERRWFGVLEPDPAGEQLLARQLQQAQPPTGPPPSPPPPGARAPTPASGYGATPPAAPWLQFAPPSAGAGGAAGGGIGGYEELSRLAAQQQALAAAGYAQALAAPPPGLFAYASPGSFGGGGEAAALAQALALQQRQLAEYQARFGALP
jgi:hypothetical protein